MKEEFDPGDYSYIYIYIYIYTLYKIVVFRTARKNQCTDCSSPSSYLHSKYKTPSRFFRLWQACH